MVTARFRNPNINFAIDEQVIEQRLDPLLGRLSLIPHELKKKASFYYGTPDRRALKEKVESSRANCFFCPERIEQVTPKFLEEINSEGRFKVGEATCFPNIFPFFEHCAVVTVSGQHYLSLKEMTPKIYGNAIQAALNYIKKVYDFDSNARYPVIGANFLIPAGSTIVHPHIQVLIGNEELYKIKLEEEASLRFRESTGTNYWEELIKKEEKLGERYIGQTGDIHWYTPFAPLGNNEVRAVVLKKSNFLDLSDQDVANLGTGISNVLHYYHKKKISSFNFLLHSAPLGKSEYSDSACVGWEIISRPPFRAFYINLDAWFIQQLAYGSLIIEFPEIIAQDMKPFFENT